MLLVWICCICVYTWPIYIFTSKVFSITKCHGSLTHFKSSLIIFGSWLDVAWSSFITTNMSMIIWFCSAQILSFAIIVGIKGIQSEKRSLGIFPQAATALNLLT